MNRPCLLILVFVVMVATAAAQISEGAEHGGSIALSPARFELEMKPGAETTVIVNLDYRSPAGFDQPTRILASLSDWNITKDGRVEYFPANTLERSASSWIIYSPGESVVAPGTIHQIRVTISVPKDARPGDHLAALTVEQRPDSIKHSERGARKMIVRYRMASVFYIKVSGLTRKGDFEDLYAEDTDTGIVVTPVLKNTGNSVIRPEASLKILDQSGNTVAEYLKLEPLPILGGSELAQPLTISERLLQGNYSVKYKIDFKDGHPPKEGVTDLIVRSSRQIASSGPSAKKP